MTASGAARATSPPVACDPAAAPAPPLDRAAAAYVARTSDALAAALRAAAAELAEPRVDDRARVLRLVERLVETIAGFALGAIAAEVLAAVRRWFGDDAAIAARAALRGRWPVAAGAPAGAPARYLADAAARPLADELAARLHVRFCRAARDVHALLELVEAVVAIRAPHRRGELATALALITCEDVLEAQLADELRFGWRVLAAAAAARPAPIADDRPARSAALWAAWYARLSGRPAPARPAPEQVGYIALVR